MKIHFLISFCFLAILSNTYGQIRLDPHVDKISLVSNPNVEALRTNAESSFEDIRSRGNWKPYDSTYVTEGKTAVWLKFEMENRSNDTLKNFLFSEEHFVITYQQNGSDFQISRNGDLFPPSQRTNKSEYWFTEIKLLPFQKSLIYIKLDSNQLNQAPNYPSLFSEIGYWEFSNNIQKEESNSIGFIYFYIISLISIFMYALVFWLQVGHRLYLYYLGYLFFQIVYGFEVLRTTSASVGNIFAYIPRLSSDFFQPTQFIFIAFYIFFISKLLTVEKYDRLLAKILLYLGIVCLIYAISHFILNHFFSGFLFADTLFMVARAIILPLNLILIFWIIFKVKHPLLIYFILGQSFFFIAAVLASYLGYIDIFAVPGHFFNFTQSPNIVFQIGLLAEVFCFSLALGQNVILLQLEKEKTSEELIAQLQENQLLQINMNRELDEKVHKKTEELIHLYTELEQEREQKIKDDFIQKIKETEMVALRSQMNPHFIFNSLNAIKHLIMTSRNDDAIIYLDDFSSLLREILQNSDRQKITVEEELDILELYLSLERNRMGTNLNFSIQVSSKEELSQFQIPPLLLQPIVENAIWHGLQPSLKAEKKLKIIFDTSENLKITIEDNGIGRTESAKKKKLHNSMGASIVQDRITLYNHLNDQKIYLKTTDLEEDGSVLGTRVTLTYYY